MALYTYADTNLPTVLEMRNTWCFGLPLADAFGNMLDDDTIQGHIESGISEVEERLGIYLKPMTIVTNGEERGLKEGIDYDISEPPYDYDAKAYRNWGFLQLRERPASKLNALKLVLPNGQVIVDFMTQPQWVKFYPKSAQVHIVPYAGDPTLFYLLGGSQTGYPFVTGQMNRAMPQMWYIDYVAGYPIGKVPAHIRDAVAKCAAIEILTVASDAKMDGVSSLSTSIDGLSESTSTAASGNSLIYQAHINEYKQEIDELFNEAKGGARSAERGITFTVL